MKQELTERQIELAIAIREVTKTPTNDSWGAFTDLTRAVAQIVEGAESLIHPTEMQKRFARAWESHAKMWLGEHDRIIRDCLGGSQKEFDRVRSHPNGGTAIRRILSRVKEVYGELTPGMKVDVNVSDILIDELGETA